MSDLTQYVPKQKHFESAYHKALLKLLPKGILWPKNQDKIKPVPTITDTTDSEEIFLDSVDSDDVYIDSVVSSSDSSGFSFFDCLFGALALELSRLEGRAFNLFKESIPGLSEEMLEDWETMLDLPEYGISTGDLTVEQRKQIAQAKFYSDYNLGLSKQFYIDYAATLGFTITIDDTGDLSKPFLVACTGADLYDIGSRVGDRLNDSAQVANVVITITAGPDDDSVLKKIFEIIKPAHVIITWVRVKLFVQPFTDEGSP